VPCTYVPSTCDACRFKYDGNRSNVKAYLVY
jgi:hypothetical protein